MRNLQLELSAEQKCWNFPFRKAITLKSIAAVFSAFLMQPARRSSQQRF
jgi:hypothetical protein